MYRRRTSLTLAAVSTTSSPLRLIVVNQFRATLNEDRNVFSSSVHHRLAYGDGRARATCFSKDPLTVASRLSTAISSSSLEDSACKQESSAIPVHTSSRIFFQSALSYMREPTKGLALGTARIPRHSLHVLKVYEISGSKERFSRSTK